jgi:hypothetical protein
VAPEAKRTPDWRRVIVVEAIFKLAANFCMFATGMWALMMLVVMTGFIIAILAAILS